MTVSRASASGVQGSGPLPASREPHRQVLSIDHVRIWYKLPMLLDAAHPLVPLASLAAGVFLLVAPRLVSVAVAIYLIAVGLLGLNGIYHFFK